MPRITQVTVAPEKTDGLVAEIAQAQGLLGLRVQRAISIHPPGDTITIESTNRSLNDFIRLFNRHGIGFEPGGSITTTEPVSIISPDSIPAIVRDTSESTWEEMELLIGKESNMTVNALLLMGISGILATIGIATNALHIVIGAMAIAPGFEPIVRISLGAVAKSRACWRGVSDTLQGYGMLMIGAALTTLVLQMLRKSPLSGEPSYLPSGVLVGYWTTLDIPSLLISAAAAFGGALLIATNRSILTAGVMIALSLIPAASITGMALVSGDVSLPVKGILRWGIEVGLVMVFSLIVFVWKRLHVQKRDMML